MLYQADWLITLDGPPLQNGWLRVARNRIDAVGPASALPREEPVRRLAHCVLLPGLINAHCHLELSGLKGKLPRNTNFPAWVKALREATSGYVPETYRGFAREGIRELLRGGTTAVIDVGNSGEALRALAESPLRGWALVEALGLDPALAQARFAEARQKIPTTIPPTSRIRFGVTAHSAYACSRELLAMIAAHQETEGVPATLHAAESREEFELFQNASGPLQGFCKGIYSAAPEHRQDSPMRYLARENIMRDPTLWVHGNHLQPGDMDLLERRNAAVAHCPSSHAFFGHAPFPFEALRARGIPICLGTDSLASADSLSMLRQMRLFRQSHPQVAAEEVLRMATQTPARALGMDGEIGRIRPGFRADFIAVEFGGPAAHAFPLPHAMVLEEKARVTLSVIDGEEAFPA